MVKLLSEHLQKVWDFVEQYTKDNDEIPMVKDIIEAVGMERHKVEGYLDTLWKRGYNVRRKK